MKRLNLRNHLRCLPVVFLSLPWSASSEGNLELSKKLGNKITSFCTQTHEYTKWREKKRNNNAYVIRLAVHTTNLTLWSYLGHLSTHFIYIYCIFVDCCFKGELENGKWSVFCSVKTANVPNNHQEILISKSPFSIK